MFEAVFIVIAILMTRYVLVPPKPLRLIAWANLAFLVVASLAFSRMTGGATSGVDALKFYSLGKFKVVGEMETFSQANFVFFMSNRLQSVLPLSYSAFNLFAAVFFSYTALLLVLRRLHNPTKKVILFWWLLTLLPGFHFWHASFGKESLQLLLIAIYFSFPYLVTRGGSLILLSLVRPHIALAIGIAEMIANIFQKKVTAQRVLTIVLGGVIALSALTYLINRISGGDGVLNVTQVWRLFQDYGSGWREGELRLNDTASPFAIVEFLLRPYFWEASSPATFFSWIDSLLMTAFGVYILVDSPIKDRLSTPWMFTVIVTLLLAFTNPNVGTSHRKKQIFPFAALIIVSESMVRRRRSNKRNVNGGRKIIMVAPGQKA